MSAAADPTTFELVKDIGLPVLTGRADVEAWLEDLAKVAEPKHGEDIKAFINRAEEKANSLGLDMHRP